MELRQLKYFQKVAELQNFSEASRLLNITQSTLSQQIKKLEEELNVTLLLRDSHHVQLTDIGEAILPAINRTLRDANACKAYLDKHPLIEPSYDVQTAQGEEVSRKKIALRIR